MNSEILAAMAFSRIRGISQRVGLKLYKSVGSALSIMNGVDCPADCEPQNWEKLMELVRAGAPEAMARAEREADFCEKHNIRCLVLNDEDYPVRLRQCDDPPLVLYYRGCANLNAQHIVSIVGTRHCTEYGKDLCARITSGIAALCPDALIVSGLAYGVDVHAHRGAINAGLPTVGVLAHGLDRVYPASHRPLAKTMLSQGGLLTEYMTETNPDKGNFVRRNRIVAGISDACVVVESADHGGAMITARLAFDYNREVFACPGRAYDEYSQGCHRLIRSNQAYLLTTAEELVEELGWISEKKRKEALNQPLQTELFPELSTEQQTVVDALQGSDGVQINVLAMQTNLPVQRVSALLFELEMKGIVKLVPGGNYRLIH